MASTTTYDAGQIIVVSVPFSNQEGSKPRPALVVSTGAFHRELPDVIVCPITSQSRHYENPGPAIYPLRHWREVGLRHPSAVRVSNILAIERSLIKRVLGTLSADDFEQVRNRLRKALGLQ